MPIDYSKYPPNWKTEIRPRILDRDGHKCKFCGVPNYAMVVWKGDEPITYDQYSSELAMNGKQRVELVYGKKIEEIKEVKIVLTIMHLDHDEENHNVSDDRLAAGCQRCRLRYDAPEKARRRAEKKYKQSLFPLK